MGGVLGDQKILGSQSASPFLVGGIQGLGGVLGESSFGSDSQLLALLHDGIAITQGLWPSFQRSLSHSFKLTTALAHKVEITRRLNQSLSVSEIASLDIIFQLFERTSLAHTLSTIRDGSVTCDESVAFREMLRVLYILLLEEGVECQVKVNGFANRYVVLVEMLSHSAAFITQITAQEMLGSAILLHDRQARYFEGLLAESLQVSTALDITLLALTALLEKFAIVDELTPYLALTVTTVDTAALAESAKVQSLLQGRSTDAVRFITLGFRLGDETYLGWVLNTESTGLTQYEQYPFNSLTRFGNRYLGAGEMGICELSGNTDNGQLIAAKLKTGVTDFGSPMRKRIDRAYLGITSEGDILLKVTSDKGVEDWYSLSPRTGDIHTERVKLGKGVKSRYWQFELTNSEGAHFELESLELVPIILSRRL